ncbi:MAG TPA: hypothetical protein VFF30_18325 [Nitrososphaerales archaeon]|nr:hypothetical protein [Nitrososphaerales archaeon]
MVYATLNQVKDELTLAYAVTTNDTELNNLIALVDSIINLRLQRYTSLPLQTEIATQLADIEARWVAARFRLKRATPQEQNQFQAVITLIESEFQEFLKNSFQRSFFGEGAKSDQDFVGVDLGQWDQTTNR